MATRTQHRATVPAKHVSEGVCEFETFRYEPSLPSTSRFNPTREPVPAAELTTCDDIVLTGLAQLGALQTGTGRSLISLFDSSSQHIITEATPSMPLRASAPSSDCPESLFLCGTAIPRPFGVCDATLMCGVGPSDQPANSSYELPLTLSNDLTSDPRFSNSPYCQPGSLARFYAAVPIRTRRGINIGVYCVIDDTPGKPWNDAYTERLREISRAIMEHFEAQQVKDLHRRNERMTRGLGSFIEGKSTMSGWRQGSNTEAYEDNQKHEGALNARQQSIQQDEEESERQTSLSGSGSVSHDVFTLYTPPEPGADLSTPQHNNGPRPFSNPSQSGSYFPENPGPSLDHRTPVGIFSKAANIIRESIEVEACLFFDATMGSYRTPTSHRKPGTDALDQVSSTGSSDESGKSETGERVWPLSQLLAFSVSGSSSIDGACTQAPAVSVAEKFISTLLRRYPKGKIFNFDANGELLSSDSSDDDQSSVNSADKIESSTPYQSLGVPSSILRARRPKNPWARQREGSVILETFPGARSVAFIPVWDPRKERWYAGGFVYTKSPTRTFSVRGELSYLRAFGMLTTSEILRFDTLLADQAKSDALGSLSHELRSPLHGVLLSAELLIDTDLNALQGNLAHTVETCSRTLLDTIDHLLDYSKINNFAGRENSKAVGSREAGNDSKQFGKKNLYSNFRLDALVEEVVESGFAGFNFQRLSVSQNPSKGNTIAADDVVLNRHLGSMQINGKSGSTSINSGDLNLDSSEVSVILSIDPRCIWMYYVQVGAIRRIVMNLFGNALKYTQRGTIKVSLTQELAPIKRRRKERVVKITVQDTGKGISPEYLKHGLYIPFSQEDSLAPGTGLGLSLVKQIASQLRGEITIQSQVGVGTTASVILPLEQVSMSPERALLLSDDDKVFEEQCQDLHGLRIRIVSPEAHAAKTASHSHTRLQDICRDWLHMKIVSDTPDETVTPDIVLWSYDQLPSVAENIEMLAKSTNVVLCPNALVAYRQFMALDLAGHAGVVEFISQPAGPRKLAKTLSLAYQRWMGLSKSSRDEIANQSVTRLKELRGAQGTSNLPAIELPPASPSSDPQTDSSSPPSKAFDWSSTSELSSTGLTPDVAPSKYLLVDDNHINLKVLSTYMKRLGVEYQTATNGQEAVDTFIKDSHSYVCVLMDISMPVMDGFEATRRIRAHEAQTKADPLPIIALSGLASEEAQHEALGSGMDVFLTKPVKLKALGDLLKARGLLDPQPEHF